MVLRNSALAARLVVGCGISRPRWLHVRAAWVHFPLDWTTTSDLFAWHGLEGSVGLGERVIASRPV